MSNWATWIPLIDGMLNLISAGLSLAAVIRKQRDSSRP